MNSMKLFLVLTLCVAAALAGNGGGDKLERARLYSDDTQTRPVKRLLRKLTALKETAEEAALEVEEQDLDLAAALETISDIAERTALDVEANEDNLKSRDLLGGPKNIKERTWSKRLLLRLEAARTIAARAVEKRPAAKSILKKLKKIEGLAERSAFHAEANEELLKSRNSLAEQENAKKRRNGLDLAGRKALKQALADLLKV